jgi:putative nucleotidyltransferase with HDIG domain
MSEALKNYVKKIDKLPTIPAIAYEILNIVGDDTVSVNKIESVVENDPAISGKILSVANSAFFGIKQPIKTLDNAIMRIGLNNVKNIALGISIMTVFDEGKGQSVLNYQRIFNHSVSVGFIAKRLSDELKLGTSDEIFINGILHDVGFLVLSRYFSDNYKDVLEHMKNGQTLLEAEKNVLEFDHADMGAWLANQWQLPNNIKDTIEYHHSPSHAKRSLKHVSVTHVADYISTKNILSPVETDPGYPLDAAALEVLGINEDDLNDIESRMVGYVNTDD